MGTKCYEIEKRTYNDSLHYVELLSSTKEIHF